MSKINRTSVGKLLEESGQKSQDDVRELIPKNSKMEQLKIRQKLQLYIIESGKIPSKRFSFGLNLQDFASQVNKTEKDVKAEHKLMVSQIEGIAITRMGIRNFDNMQNQDVILEDHIPNKCKIYGIFDGHGQFGRVIALTIKNIFQNFLNKYTQEIKNENSIFSIESIVKKVLQKTNAYLLHCKAEQCLYSGATALIVILTSISIYTFNIGNSRMILAKYHEKEKKILPFQVTHDHTLSRFDERARVLKSGSYIEPYKNQRGQFIGPDRLWAPNERFPGIYVTRTLGLSCAYKLGVIPEPEMSIFNYNKNFKYIIMGSDGLWSVFKNDEIVNMLEKSNIVTLAGYVNSIIYQALKRWREKKDLMDDVSLIVIPLIHQ